MDEWIRAGWRYARAVRTVSTGKEKMASRGVRKRPGLTGKR
jgi:hypothetical protein